MCASVWFKSFGTYFDVKAHEMWEGNVTIRSEIQIENICLWGFKIYKRRSDIKEFDITKFRV
jgi:hypothetical protein